MTGMKFSDSVAAALYGLPTTAESPFHGDLRSRLEKWGYNDNTPPCKKLHDLACNMASAMGHMLSKTSADLGDPDIDTISKGKGSPNECFQTEHINGPTTINNKHGGLPDKKNRYYINCGNRPAPQAPNTLSAPT